MAVEYEVNFRERPECYRVQAGEQSVFKVQPYKDELLSHWGFKDEATAEAAVEALRAQYEAYRAQEDFVGMDMVRKYLRMGVTRAMCDAKSLGVRKYDADGREREPRQWADAEKRAAAVIVREAWRAVLHDPVYERRKAHHRTQVNPAKGSPMRETD